MESRRQKKRQPMAKYWKAQTKAKKLELVDAPEMAQKAH